MHPPLVEEIVALLADENPSEEALAARIATLAQTPDGLVGLRAAWPTDRLPIVRDYFCVQRLDFGAAGVVYKAFTPGGNPQWVALKVLRLVAEEETARFLEREVKILQALDCPGVARYLDAGQVGGSHYLAMELVRGEPLDAYLAARDLPLEDRLAVFQKACDIVAEVHTRGVIHRDLKPSHILVDEHGQPHLVDFGLSAAHTDEWATQVRRAQTAAGRIMGTVRYMSPEQAWGGLIPIDHRSDIWSLGVMLYEIATDGEYPYDLTPLPGMTPTDSLLHRLQSETPRRPHIRVSKIAPALSTLIARCLTFEPRRRVASARLLADDLTRLGTTEAIRTTPLPLHYRAWRIAVGLALSSRLAMWTVTVVAVLVMLTASSRMLRVGYRVWDEGLSGETRKRLLMAEDRFGTPDFLIVGMGDSAYREVPRRAAELGWAGVTADLRTWRQVHGRLMERLAPAAPRAVVWDVFFPSQQAGDEAFVRGVQALASAGVPVAVAAITYSPQGVPALSPTIREPLAETLYHGLIVARNMDRSPGEFVFAMRRGEPTYAALALTVFSAICYPEARPEARLEGRERKLLVRYRAARQESYLRDVDAIGLSQVVRQLNPERGLQAGDELGIKALALTPLSYWQARTVPYETLLDATAEDLIERAGGKIVVFADTREGNRRTGVDRHPVRYPTGLQEDVPGGYLLTDAIKGMFGRQYRTLEFPLSPGSFSAAVGMTIAGCLAGIPLARRRLLATRAAEWTAPLVCCLGAIACLIAVREMDTRLHVELALAGIAFNAALAVSLWIEFTRRRVLRRPRETAA